MARKKAGTAKKSASAQGKTRVSAASKGPAKAATRSTPKATPSKKESPKSSPAPKRGLGLEFIGTFPIRRSNENKKSELKKPQNGPFFEPASFVIGYRASSLAQAQYEELQRVYMAKHTADTLSGKALSSAIDTNPLAVSGAHPGVLKNIFTKELDEALLNGDIQLAVHDMRDIPIDLPKDIVVAAALRREDPRDALVTRSTYGAIQELPFKARIGTSSRRCIMQIRSLRPDLDILPAWGPVQERLNQLEAGDFDALVVPWASLRRLNLSPRYYVALQVDQVLPAPCQGIIGITCLASQEDLINRLRLIEDSEASWASRCERAFLQKLSGHWDAPVGAFAHRKGTQDPWILDIILGDPRSGETLRHREIGTSRCKPESLADKAFSGAIAKGARKFLPFT